MPALRRTAHPRRPSRLTPGDHPALRLASLLFALGALLVLWAAGAAGAALAAGAFVGGVDEYPAYLANDHTPVQVRFVATGLTPSTPYFLKIRLTVAPTPGGATNRGWTFNPASGQWVQERDYWTNFPVVTSDANGTVAGSAGRAWIRFGDERESGPRYLLVSLSATGADDTLNGTLAPLVTVFDAVTSGLRAHNGAVTGVAAGLSADAVDATTGTTVLAIGQTELNGLDDDGDGTVDNEDHGPAGASGDFGVALPLAQAFSVRLDGTGWAPGQNVTGTLADVDIALGAADTAPPTAVTTLQAAAGNGRVDLSWTPATDNVSGPGTLRYLVHRWPDTAPIRGSTNYTPVPVHIASTTATAYADTDVVNGTAYHYTVRAQDAATNTGPRTTQADATPDGTPPGPVTALVATPHDGSVHLEWTNPTDLDLAEVSVRRGEGATPAAPTDGVAVYSGAGDACNDAGLVNGTTYTYAVFTRDTVGNWSVAVTIDAVPHQLTATTLATNKTVVPFGGGATLSGTLNAGGAPLVATSLEVESSADGAAFVFLQTLLAPLGTVSLLVNPSDKTWYRLHYTGDAAHAGSYSPVVSVTPRVFLGRPAAPGTVRKAVRFRLRGVLKPRHADGAHSVVIRCYRRVGGHWRLKKSVTAVNSDYSTYTRYSTRLSLPTAGRWQIRAYARADAGHAATTSSTRTITVR